MTLLYRRCLHFLYTIQNNHSLFYFSVSQKHSRFRLAILIYNLEMWRSYCNMKTAAWNYDDLWLGSAFSNGIFNTTQLRCMFFWGANPQSISWLALCRANLQSLKLLSQHAAKASHISSQGPSVDCSFTLGNVRLSQRASTRPWLQPGSCRCFASEEDFSQRHHC